MIELCQPVRIGREFVPVQMVIDANSIIRNALEKGAKMDLLMEQWDFLQSQCACFINSDLPGLPSQLHQAPGKPVK
jgi:DNA-directed RNA polymerase III subunit RPC1